MERPEGARLRRCWQLHNYNERQWPYQLQGPVVASTVCLEVFSTTFPGHPSLNSHTRTHPTTGVFLWYDTCKCRHSTYGTIRGLKSWDDSTKSTNATGCCRVPALPARR
ncbi:hypothetical protein FOTG_05915 [Fusarium oxysporum f. sp. vasinfectum 25433]|uniref:Uncharacterized protein n=1 Tax=Fusarium oxysporum f. sp. vasinfectum 25433 TaxID=1089449 RepID=X0N847_FUSOX|nr:hypothetical protein FOTG_05915 [Fusarium oxysporum f. sp. vasinfectum 25433]EXM28790.1 hypothetical protein FOTG_05915 [Fusarium oxysporum f. sp. vasinfectum 25433]